MADRRRGTQAVAVLLALLFAAPLLGLVVQAFADRWRAPSVVPQELGLRGFRVGFADGGALEALGNSALIAVASTTLAVLLAWPAARVLGEARLRHPAPVVLLLALPLLVPPLATGTGLTSWFVRLDLVDRPAGVVLAHLTTALPYVVLVLVGAFGCRLTELEEAAAVLGLSPARRLLAVTLPTVRPVLVAAIAIGLLTSWSQYGTSLAVGGGLPTLPVVLLPYVGSDPQVAAALALLFLTPAVVVVAVAARAGRGGR